MHHSSQKTFKIEKQEQNKKKVNCFTGNIMTSDFKTNGHQLFTDTGMQKLLLQLLTTKPQAPKHL